MQRLSYCGFPASASTSTPPPPPPPPASEAVEIVPRVVLQAACAFEAISAAKGHRNVGKYQLESKFGWLKLLDRLPPDWPVWLQQMVGGPYINGDEPGRCTQADCSSVENGTTHDVMMASTGTNALDKMAA